ncbi:hypothetical protein TNCV_3807801 [Trichonephila clavipes]|nr:hypothetical protein TNCV_3807801 [Trichonephila clavipes]
MHSKPDKKLSRKRRKALQNCEIAGSTGIGKGTTFVMARFKIPVEVFTLTTLTRPSLPGEILQEYAP